VTHRFLITGGPGFGKSSIISELEKKGHTVFHEIARHIIQNQLVTGGTFTPWQDVQAFSDQVLEGRKIQYDEGLGKTAFYDRGVPDIAAFLKKDKKEIPPELWDYCLKNKYFNTVFITPPWESIFHSDAERKEDFMNAIRVHRAIESVYTELGYQLVHIPMGSIPWRAQFLLDFAGIK